MARVAQFPQLERIFGLRSAAQEDAPEGFQGGGLNQAPNSFRRGG